METQLIHQRSTQQMDSSNPSGESAGLSEVQASCQRLTDAADAEITRALSGNTEEFMNSTRQLRGGQ
jgi:hypothetical protein